MKNNRILVIGDCCPLMLSLIAGLRDTYGRVNIISAGKMPAADLLLDASNRMELDQVVRECAITQIYFLKGLQMDRVEEATQNSWDVNVKSLLLVLDVAVKYKLDKVFWPSSIAASGNSEERNCLRLRPAAPDTAYGISKRTGEYWCNYYFKKFGLDVRSVRFPFITVPEIPLEQHIGNYTADACCHALRNIPYTCYLSEDTCLPMLFLPDAVRAVLELMDAPKEKISCWAVYNLSALFFAPCDLTAQIRKAVPAFEIHFEPDRSDYLARILPVKADDGLAREDWGWNVNYDLSRMVTEMLGRISREINIPLPSVNLNQKIEFYPDETF